MITKPEPPITAADAIIAELPDLRVEVSHSEDMVILQQNSSTGPASRIAIHKWQVRMLAGHFGLLKRMPMSESKVAVTLARRLRVLQERIDHLSHYLHHHSDMERADLSYEQLYSLATCEIADQFVIDLNDLVEPTSDLCSGGPKGAAQTTASASTTGAPLLVGKDS